MVQVPALHEGVAWAGAHVLPQPPQCAAVVLVLVSQPVFTSLSQSPKPALHVIWHAPETHEVPAPHDAHAAPPAPHDIAVSPARHVAPLQQPAHEAASHTHAPPEHRCPAEHAARPPHVQFPAALQPSDRRSHATQAAPGAPHAVAVGGETQVAPEQQPDAQLVALQLVHTPPTHEPLAQSPSSLHSRSPSPCSWTRVRTAAESATTAGGKKLTPGIYRGRCRE